MSRSELIGQLIEKGYTPERAIAVANKAYPKSPTQKAVNAGSTLVGSVISPVATVAEETADLTNRITRGMFGMFKP